MCFKYDNLKAFIPKKNKFMLKKKKSNSIPPWLLGGNHTVALPIPRAANTCGLHRKQLSPRL